MRFPPALRSPVVAALLSFVLPGLGQAASGAVRRAALVILPAVAIVLAALLIGRRGFVNGALDPQFLTVLLVVDLAALGYHLWAVLDAFFVARRRAPHGPRGGLSPRAPRQPSGGNWQTRGSVAVLLLLLAATVGLHGYVAVVDVKAQGALDAAFAVKPPWSDDTATPGATAAGATSQAGGTSTPTTTATPAPTPTPNLDWAADGQLNVVLIGIDRGPGGNRNQGLRPDTMILLQVDIKSGRAAMFGIPRNLVNVPLPPEVASHYKCHCWGDLLDYFWQEAADTHPAWYTTAYGTDRWVRGIKALEGAIGTLTAVKVDGAMLIDLTGFIKIVDAIGGIDINVPKPLRDTQYPILEHPGTMTIDIKAGQQHMNGTVALEYARSRKSTDDYDRMRRQQLVLRAIREKVGHPCSLIPRLPDILDTINGTFWTDLPINSAPQLLGLAERVGTANTASYTLVPAKFASGSTDVNVPEYLDAASIAKVRDLVAHGLDKVPSGGDSGGGGGGGGFGC